MSDLVVKVKRELATLSLLGFYQGLREPANALLVFLVFRDVQDGPDKANRLTLRVAVDDLSPAEDPFPLTGLAAAMLWLREVLRNVSEQGENGEQNRVTPIRTTGVFRV